MRYEVAQSRQSLPMHRNGTPIKKGQARNICQITRKNEAYAKWLYALNEGFPDLGVCDAQAVFALTSLFFIMRALNEAYAKRHCALNEGAPDPGFCDTQASFA